ncbi:MAG: deoxyguanosinetriphosphate triphosphohydrolase [Verrucomicrobiales bacterium]|nr:deoxyguanosinetriphosphate triphosphohydrolase [Verrucomicrobiales bacterium]
MPTIRETLERRERDTLAPYAQRVDQSVGRGHAERQHHYRTDYQRDRARVIHSRAFRRLERKTQVFLNGTGDHFRTRLTHTIEVSSITRAIACALALNEDLAETIALAHDLGHAPFGHSGEKKLNELMRGQGGFEHNVQSLRVVDLIESKYPEFPGLNLSYEVLEGLQKHNRGYERPAFGDCPSESFAQPTLEGQVANLADEITYYSHDLDDGLESGLITVDQLADLDIWRTCCEQVNSQFPHLAGDLYVRYVIRILIDMQVERLVAETRRRITEASVQSPDDVRRHPDRLVAYDPGLKRANLQLRAFLYKNLYYHPEVNGANMEATAKIETVFKHYVDHPDELGKETAKRIDSEGLARTVCDYIAGMTDRFLQDEYVRLSGV